MKFSQIFIGFLNRMKQSSKKRLKFSSMYVLNFKSKTFQLFYSVFLLDIQVQELNILVRISCPLQSLLSARNTGRIITVGIIETIIIVF